MCWTSRRVPWKALLAVTALNTSQMGWIPRSRAASALSTTRAAAPMPMIMPCRRRSKGMAASSTTSSVAAAPLARKPAPIHPIRWSEVTSSAEMMITRLHRPARIQSSRQRHRLGGARASGVDLRVGTAGADEFGELRMSHRQDSGAGSAGRRRRVLFDGGAQLVDVPVDLLRQGGMTIRPSPPERACSPAWPIARGGRGPRNSAPSRRRRSRKPGKAEAKITPVSSRRASGKPQRSGNCVPLLVVL